MQNSNLRALKKQWEWASYIIRTIRWVKKCGILAALSNPRFSMVASHKQKNYKRMITATNGRLFKKKLIKIVRS